MKSAERESGRRNRGGAGRPGGPLRALRRMAGGVPPRLWAGAAVTANSVAPPSNYWLGAGSMMVGGPVNELSPYLLGASAADAAVGVAKGRGAAAAAVSALTIAGQAELIRRAMATGTAVDAALDDAIGRGRPPSAGRESLAARLSPVPLRSGDVEVLREISYLDPDGVDGADAAAHARAEKLCRLDVYRSRSGTRPGGGSGPAPVLVHVHGGMWMGSDKRYEALPLLHRMAARGWVCVSVNYRLCPKDPFPAQILDVKRAIAWVRAHASEYGADPSFIAITGGSAGGHLASLAALTSNDPRLQPHLPDGADTSIQAAVSQYGIYDFTAQSGTAHATKRRDRFLAPMILKKDPVDDAADFALASPLLQADASAPPFFVLHGTDDTGVEIEESRHFVRHLRNVSDGVVAFAELPGAQHAYDHLNSIRTRRAGRGVERFLEWAAASRV
ncbi:alpha/beta hydrolase [Tomitella fengzijianii]|uniref:Alpha/beta hydrolase n=1 Tax=Tomitella fengzijianii TaxID=2597660 RepID=A0A516X1Q6_9ACTN|nr:alpha/beta hydrolase [Tomitella fengzijianii]QDQ96960.1 alpha/beta hydrolase [Tomitella fengzijianii]